MRKTLAAVLAVGLLQGLTGIRWGLPGPARVAAFPPDFQPSSENALEMTQRWQKLYEEIAQAHRELKREEPVTYVQGRDEIEPGWNFPPDKLLNSYRSFLLRTENPDEQKSFVVLGRMRPWRFEFEPLFIQYGGAFIYPLGAYLQALSWARAVRVVPDMAYYLQEPAQMGRLYLAARVFILLCQLGTLWVLYDLGVMLGGETAGALACLLWMLCPIVAATSHIVKPHPFAALWVVAAARWAAKKRYLLSGVAAGLGAGANFAFGVFFALPLLGWLLGGRKKAERAAAARATITGLLVFFALNPYALLARRDFVWETTIYPQSSGATLAALGALLVPRLVSAAGLAAALCFVWGLVETYGRKEARLVWWTAVGGLVLSWALLATRWGFVGGVGAWRFFYPALALFCVLAGASISRMPKRMRLAAILFILVDGVPRCAVYLRNMAFDEGGTRARAAEWVDKNVPAGSTLGLSRYPQPATSPILRYDQYKLVVYSDPKYLESDPPQFLLVDESGASELARSGLAEKYDLVDAQEPFRFLWAKIEDETFFANAKQYVYRRKA